MTDKGRGSGAVRAPFKAGSAQKFRKNGGWKYSGTAKQVSATNNVTGSVEGEQFGQGLLLALGLSTIIWIVIGITVYYLL